jgi:hypothetical protein
MKSSTYDALKFISLVVLPALATLYVGMGLLWGAPAVEQVVGTIALVDTVLGIVIGKSSKNFKDLIQSPQVIGDLIVIQDPDGVPTGQFKLVGTEENPIFTEGRLAGFRVKREVRER